MMEGHDYQILWVDDIYQLLEYRYRNSSRLKLYKKRTEVEDGDNLISSLISQWEHKCIQIMSSSIAYDKKSTLLKILWCFDNSVYCDALELKNNIEPVIHTDIVVDVAYQIGYCHAIWEYGLILLCEPIPAQLNIYDTSLNRVTGSIALFSSDSSVQSFVFNKTISQVQLIVRHYDNLTKKSYAYLNSYSVPSFNLITSVELIKGFSNYFIIEKDIHDKTDCGIAICSTCEVLERTVIQWFVVFDKPWMETELPQYSCDAAISSSSGVSLKVHKYVKNTKQYLRAHFHPLSLDQGWSIEHLL